MWQNALCSSWKHSNNWSKFLFVQAVEEEDDDKKENSTIKKDEELVHNMIKSDEDELEAIKKLAMMPKQPDQVKLEEMRRFKLKEKLMYKIIKDSLNYIIFVLILLTVAYGNRDYRSHNVNNALTKYFINGSYAGRMGVRDVSWYEILQSYFVSFGLPWHI